MINRREHAICKRRGHAGFLHEQWMQCKWCKTWVREVRKIEERETEPPEAELHGSVVAQRGLERVKRDLDEASRSLKGGPPSKGPRRKK